MHNAEERRFYEVAARAIIKHSLDSRYGLGVFARIGIYGHLDSYHFSGCENSYIFS